MKTFYFTLFYINAFLAGIHTVRLLTGTTNNPGLTAFALVLSLATAALCIFMQSKELDK